jgi:hypothetical protein
VDVGNEQKKKDAKETDKKRMAKEMRKGIKKRDWKLTGQEEN